MADIRNLPGGRLTIVADPMAHPARSVDNSPDRGRPRRRRSSKADPVRVAVVRDFLDFQNTGTLRGSPPATLADNAERRQYSQSLNGMLRHKRLLEHEAARLARGKLARLDGTVVAAAMLGLFQLRFLQAVPPHAAVYEAVQVAGALGFAHAKGWVNAVLRAAQRDHGSGDFDAAALPLALRTSHPDWMVARWRTRYGESACTAICDANNAYNGVVVRVESVAGRSGQEASPGMAADAVCASLAAEGILAEAHPVLPDALRVTRASAILVSPLFRQGRLYVQDAASQLLTLWSAPLLRGWVVDVCAAPGGKLSHVFRLASKGTRMLASDLAAARLGLIRDNLARLRLPPLPLMNADGRRLPLRQGVAGAVLLDAPCMATGQIRKYPELKWSKRPEDIPPYAALQKDLLDEAARVVTQGGVILYSTCSLEPEENEQQIAAFLLRHREFARVPFSAIPPPEGLKRQVTDCITPAGDFQTLPSPDWMGLYGALLRKGSPP